MVSLYFSGRPFVGFCRRSPGLHNLFVVFYVISSLIDFITNASVVKIASFFISLFLVVNLYGQTNVFSDKKVKDKVIQGLAYTHNFEFEKAETVIRELEVLLPNHPLSPVMKGINYYWQWNPSRKNVIFENLMRLNLEEALKKSEALLKVNNKDYLAKFIVFTSHGILAQADVEKGEKFSAIGNCKNAYKVVKEGFRYMDQLNEFYLTCGIYNYYRERFPELYPVYKSLLVFMDKGDKVKGIEQLQHAYQYAVISGTDAANYIVNAYYKYENNFAKGMVYAREVSKKYPNNLYFCSKYLEGLIQTSQLEETDELLMKLFRSGNTVYTFPYYVYKAMISEKEKDYTAAKSYANLALKISGSNKVEYENLLGYTNMVLARCYAKEGNAAKAKEYFKAASKTADYPATKNEAQKRVE